jgi:hypothetical protein
MIETFHNIGDPLSTLVFNFIHPLLRERRPKVAGQFEKKTGAAIFTLVQELFTFLPLKTAIRERLY